MGRYKKKDEKADLRRLDVMESGEPGDVLIVAYSMEHAKRKLKRYLVEMYGWSEEEAEETAGTARIELRKRKKTMKEIEKDVHRVFDEYGVIADPDQKTLYIRGDTKNEVMSRLRRYLIEDLVFSEEEADRFLENKLIKKLGRYGVWGIKENEKLS